MNQDDIIHMAREAGVQAVVLETGTTLKLLEHFAALVAAAEREACAQIAMEFRVGAGSPVCAQVAHYIRARSQP